MTETKVYDLDAICEEEGKGQEPFLFRAGGKKFKIPPPLQWPDSVYAISQTGDIVTAAHDLLGDQYEKYEAAGGTAAKLMALIRNIEREQGSTLPESTASTDS